MLLTAHDFTVLPKTPKSYHPFKTSAFFRGRGQKFAKFADDSSKKLPTEGVGVKNLDKLPTS